MKFITSIGENTAITLSGKLDHTNASALLEELKSLVGKNVKRLDYYCADLEYISSAGIRAMVFSKQKIDKNVDVEVYLHNASSLVKDVFVLSGLEDYYVFVD